MSYRVALFALTGAVALLSLGCSHRPDFVAKYEPWRDDEERACLASGYVQETPWLTSRSALNGPSVCGAVRPFEMAAAAQGRVSMKPPAVLRCSIIPSIERWVQEVIEPAALHFYGVPLQELKVAASYGCRPMNNLSGAHLSEHGHANALDVSGFLLRDGTYITVRDGWRGNPRDAQFLRAVHAGACEWFTTVLGPDFNAAHADHIHVDLMRRTNASRNKSCR